MKTYYEFMNEITDDELYDGLLGHGLFSEKLPPAFTSVPFLDYCKTNPGFKKEKQDYISFNSMRNINIPRLMGIPSPFQYEQLCSVLKSNWSKILLHFKNYTVGQPYPISRIHIRKLYDKVTKTQRPELFEMNYKNWKADGSPDNELLITGYKASKFIVKTDISTCFPSIYSHSLPWALVGKDIAKANRVGSLWYNRIDKACQRMKDDETHGLLIGPHSSNLLAEIILVVVDKKLWDQGYHFYRNIDDYNCYVDSYEEAQRFLALLDFELRQFDLRLNYKKTKIEELPISSTKHWVHQLNSISIVASYGKTSYKEVNNYLDVAIKLTDQVGDSAVLKYCIKVLSEQKNITINGRTSAVKRLLHLAILYPYLLPLMEHYVFNTYKINKGTIASFTNALYQDSLRIYNLEGICYSIYFSLIFDFDIIGINCQDLISTGDCLVMLFAWLYFRRRGGTEVAMLKTEAMKFNNTSIGRYWLFVYEVLTEADLKDDWQIMKRKGVSFIKVGI